MKSSRYLEFILRRKCFLDFFKAMNYHVDAKEWTEVIGMYFFMNKVIGDKKFDIVIDAGCGKRPTLGTWLALNRKDMANIISIDPALDLNATYALDINNLNQCKGCLVAGEEEGIINKDIKSCLLLANHAHITKKEVKDFLSNFEDWIYITSPCCYDNRLDQKAIYYKDPHVHSKKNEYYYFEKGV